MSTLAVLLLTVSLVIIHRQQEHDLLIARKCIDEVYDYIIVGAGTSGCVVASRLSENANLKILVVEAGSGETIVSDMPSMAYMAYGSRMDWNFTLSSQTNALFGYNNNRVKFPEGRVMGGSSTINGMAFVRGLTRDFDNWEKNFGVKGWSWNEVLPYFIKSENNTDPNMIGEPFHGTNGEMTISTPKEPRLVHTIMIKAAQELGYKEIDLNDPNTPVGVAIQQMNLRFGARVSAAKAFLNPVINRTNLHIWAKALVIKINFNNKKRAVSVVIQKSGKTSVIRARKEIIISAGTINTAKLLMLSGIGPKDHLNHHKIPIVADLPVGNNFHDCPVTYGVHFTINTTQKSSDLLETDITNFFLNGSGPLTQGEKACLRLSSVIEDDKSWPDIQIFPGIGSFADYANSVNAQNAINIRPDIWDAFYKSYSGQSTLTFTPMLNRPQSRGKIRLKSNNYKDEPIIDPNFFSINSDLKSLVEAMKMSYTLAKTKAFTDIYQPKPFLTRVPNCPSFSSNSSESEAYLECVAKTLTFSFSHPAGSARMGSIDDPKAVVSSELKVYGVYGLRVIDVSVVPQCTSGALFATALMIGERGAVFILNDYLRKNQI